MPARSKENEKKKRARKAPWTSEEDRLLIALASEYRVDSIDWHSISKSFGPERCAKRCRERWVEYINPALSTCPFTAEEDAFIVKQQQLHGNNWKEIARLLTTSKRSPAVVKTRWHQVQRRLRAQEEETSRITTSSTKSTIPTTVAPKKTSRDYFAVSKAESVQSQMCVKRVKKTHPPCSIDTFPVPSSNPNDSLVPLLIDALTEQCTKHTDVSSVIVPSLTPPFLESSVEGVPRGRIDTEGTDTETTPRSVPEITTTSSVLAHWEQQQSDALAAHYRELHNAWAAKMLATAYQKQQQQNGMQSNAHPAMQAADVSALAHWQHTQHQAVVDMIYQPWQPLYVMGVNNQAPMFSQQQQQQQVQKDASEDDIPKFTPFSTPLMSDTPSRSFSSGFPLLPTRRFDHRSHFRG